MMRCIYKGFDGLDVSFAAQIPVSLSSALEISKERAQRRLQPVALAWNGLDLCVAQSGAKGGYAFQCTTGGELGIVWFFKKPNPRDPWGVRASCRSFGLATKGLGGMRAELYAIMDALGVMHLPEGESISRVDYAVDLLIEGFELKPEQFVMHSQTNRADHTDTEPVVRNGPSGRVTSVTIGRMPGRQAIVYDKRAEIIAKRKPAWWSIWNRNLQELGLGVLDPTDTKGPRVWRVELRAGKEHLKDAWAVRSWADLDQHFGSLVNVMLKEIRYSAPTLDTNRSRWPDAPLWQAVRNVALGDLVEMMSQSPPDLIKRIQLEAHDKLLTGQMVGLLVTRAAIHGLEQRDLAKFARRFVKEFQKSAEEAPKHFAAKMAQVKARYAVDRGTRSQA